MHSSLFCTIFFLLIYSYQSAALCEAGRQTVLVLGHSDYNLLKISFVQRLVNDTDVEKAFDECGAASFLTFHSDKSGTFDKQLNHHLVQATFLNSQTCTVTITTKGTDEMSLEELQTLREMIYYVNSGLIVIEIGNKATQTTVILEHSTFCWGITSLHIDAPNTVLLCNDVKISETPLLNGAKIKTLFENDNDQNISPSPATTITWPSLFPSVMAAGDSLNEKKSRSSKKTAQKSTREIYYKKGRKIAINWDEQEPELVDIEHLRKKEKKVACKYRKSCYETGILPNLKAEKTVFSTDQNAENVSDLDEIDEDDTLALKVLCKYRPSCYSEIGMDMSELNHKKSKGVLIAKKSAFLETESRPRKKESIREIAKKAVKEVEMKDRQDRKAKISVIEKHLSETEEKLEMKNRCKYRKSCYESGKLPEVEGYRAPSWLSIEPVIDYASVYLNKGEKDEDEKSFEEKNELQKKLYCKYRKSCYDTGIAPEIDQTQKFHFEEVVERAPAQIPLEVRCKYRKSCYKTGIVPDFTKPIKHIEIKSKPIPVTVEDLKLHCKYRKSCYREKALEIPKKDEKDDDDDGDDEKQRPNERILVEEVGGEDEQKTVGEKIEETVEEVVEEVPKKVKRIKDKLPPIIIHEEPEIVQPKKKSKSKHSHEEKEKEPVDEEEKLSKKSKKPKSKEQDEIPSSKKSKSRKSTEVENLIEEKIIVEETEPEYISSFHLKDKEPNDVEEIIVDEPITEEFPKKDTKSKKPKKKISKNDAIKFDENEESDGKKHQHDAGDVNLKQKLECKYRISCYENHVPPHIRNDPLVWHYKKNYLSVSSAPPTPDDPIPEERWNQLNDVQRKVECKYRKSCYETRKLPPILTATDGIFHVKHVFADHLKHEDAIPIEDFQKRREIEKKLYCKYRKSCYESGKLPKIDGGVFYYPTHSPKEEEIKALPANLAHNREIERKLECKYRKSCYKSGKLPPLSPASVETVIESIHDNPKETLQQRCKYRKSCYAAAAELKKSKHEHRNKHGIIDEETLVVKNIKPSIIRKESSNEKEEAADTSSEEKRSKKSDPKSAKKQKQKTSSSKKQKEKDDDDSREDEYKEISKEESKSKVNATELAKNLTTRLKVACKYRQSCYETAVNEHLPPEQIMRMRGIKCSKYRLSCREQLGLPPIIRAPIGPSGRKLCRKKKPENGIKM